MEYAAVIPAIVLMSPIWHGALALLLSTPRIEARYVAVSGLLDRICGALLIALGLKLAWDSR